LIRKIFYERINLKRALSLDFGDARIGVAISDEMGWTAQSVGFIKRSNLQKDLGEIAKVMAEYGNVGTFVVGMPFNMDGSEGERVVKTRAFIKQLVAHFNLPVVEIDERLTTWEAEKMLIEAKMSRRDRKGKIDQVAAAIILQAYLSQTTK
jgi:putative Holliday junction resolvase